MSLYNTAFTNDHYPFLFFSIFSIFLMLGSESLSAAEKSPVQTCPAGYAAPPSAAYSEVYQTSPFKEGETALYKVTYAGIFVGYATMKVQKPVQIQGIWHRQFYINASTGEWYDDIYTIRLAAESYTHPVNFQVSSFYLGLTQRGLFSSSRTRRKWFTFNHPVCKVREKIEKGSKPAKYEEFDLTQHAKDAFGMVYYLRSLNYEVGKPQRTLVYSSKKNWWLEANPLAKETVSVPVGTFETFKLKLETYLGEDLQQKGEVYIWIATTSTRPLVMIHADVKIGKLVWELLEFGKEQESQ